ncbi:MAG: hypothetical protein ACFFAO_17455, partial [Candidatus Hermodarchaeota archaeon]
GLLIFCVLIMVIIIYSIMIYKKETDNFHAIIESDVYFQSYDACLAICGSIAIGEGLVLVFIIFNLSYLHLNFILYLIPSFIDCLLVIYSLLTLKKVKKIIGM